MMRRAAVATIAWIALSAHAALALQPGVFTDPNSPAGKEYALYTTGARSQGAGTPQPGLFGAGITPPGGPGGPANASAGPGNTRTGAAPTTPVTGRAPAPGTRPPTGTKAGSLWVGTSWIPWVILGVLVPAGLAGLGAFLTRRGRGSGQPVPGSPPPP
jgi:hypothetical protein